MPFQSDKQKRWMYANEPEIAREWSDRYGAANGGIMDWAAQGGMKNYLGEQEMVNAPKHWQSAPGHETTELAYITPQERDALVDMDMYGTMNGSPNEGPSGLMSLNGWGDKSQGFGTSGGGTKGTGGHSYGDKERYSTNVTTGSPHGKGPQTVTSTKTVSPKDHFEQSWTGQPGFLGFGGGYRNLKTPGSTAGGHKSRFNPLAMLLGLINPALGMAVRGFQGLQKHGKGFKKGFDEFGKHNNLMSYFNRNKKPKNMSQFEDLGLYTDRIKQKAFDDEALYSDNYSDMKISDTSFDQGSPNINDLTDFNEVASEQEQIGESTDIFSPPAYEEFGPDLEAYEEFAPNEDDGINSIDRVFKRFNRR